MLLPETDAIFGRNSKPNSHYLYFTALGGTVDKAAVQFKDIDGGDDDRAPDRWRRQRAPIVSRAPYMHAAKRSNGERR